MSDPYHYSNNRPLQAVDAAGLTPIADTDVPSWSGAPPPSVNPVAVDPFDGSMTQAQVRAFLFDHFHTDGSCCIAMRGEDWKVIELVEAQIDTQNRPEHFSKIDLAREFGLYFHGIIATQNGAEIFSDIDKSEQYLFVQGMKALGVQSIRVCGDRGDSPLYCVGVTRLPSLKSSSIGETIGHFILYDVTSGAAQLDIQADGVHPRDGIFSHELVHVWQQVNSGQSTGQWTLSYILDVGRSAEACAKQVGPTDRPADRVKC